MLQVVNRLVLTTCCTSTSIKLHDGLIFPDLIQPNEARPDFGENVRGGGKIFRGGATMISRTEQQRRTVYTDRDFTRTLRSRAYNPDTP